MTARNDNRIQWVDQAKGSAIILVVLGHVLTNGISAGTVTQVGYRNLASFIYSFHMPLFFFISGYLQTVSSRQTVSAACAKYKRNLLDLAVPYVTFSSAYLLVKLIFGSTSAVVNRVSVLDFLNMLVIPVGEYWYLYSLLLFTTVAFLLRILFYTENRKIAESVYPLAIVVVVSAVIYFLLDGMSSEVGIVRASHQAVYYFLGMFIRFVGSCGEKKFAIASKWRLCICMVLLVVLYGVKFGFAVSYAVLDLAIALLMIAFFAWLPVIKNRILAELGKASLPIYLFHVFSVVACKVLFQKIGIDNPLVCIFGAAVISVIIPYCAYKYIVEKVKWLLFFVKPSGVIKKQQPYGDNN